MEKGSVKKCRLLVIGGSAGSLEVLLKVLPALSITLPFPVIIVVHRKSSLDTVLTGLLASKTALKVAEAEEKDKIVPGNIYVAPADYHLLIEKDGTLSLDFSEKVNFSRPSIDVTFETAAEAYGVGVVGLLLSGASSDGSNGLKLIKQSGGVTIVQNPFTAQVGYMPQRAIAVAEVDYIVDAEDMAEFINVL